MSDTAGAYESLPRAERFVQRDLLRHRAMIWERDLGVVHKLFVSFLVFGKAIAARFRGLVQAVVIYITSYTSACVSSRSPS